MVDELREQLLARAALAGQEHGRVGVGHFARQGDRFAELRRHAEHPHLLAVAGVPLQPFALGLGLARDEHRMRRAAHEDLELRGRKRLRQILPGAETQRLEARVDARLAGHDDRERRGVRGERGGEQFAARHLAHVPVDQHDVERASGEQILRLAPLAADRHIVAVVSEHAGAALAQRVFVIDDQQTNGPAAFDGCRREAGGGGAQQGSAGFCPGARHRGWHHGRLLNSLRRRARGRAEPAC